MACHRMFLIGVVVLLLGVQLRVVDSYVLNEKASEIIQKRIDKRQSSATLTQYTSLDPYDDYWDASLMEPSSPQLKTVRPPGWLGWSLISVGGVLILTCPCFRD